MDANIRLSEEVIRKTKSFERLKVEAEKCSAQSEKFSDEKTEFESAIYAKLCILCFHVSHYQGWSSGHHIFISFHIFHLQINLLLLVIVRIGHMLVADRYHMPQCPHALYLRPLFDVKQCIIGMHLRATVQEIEFLGVLNSKKAKLRELLDQFSKQKTMGKLPEDGEESTDKTKIFDVASDEEKHVEEDAKTSIGTSRDVPASRPCSQKRSSCQ
ncbi:uncharacterized protein LOC131166681 [Malania oleifera]|uniref:uncharacterized protein LOC131166681 n=1 Tax=Malania oleifera TaxID=397392 RepID=UPI0025AE2865|nr:uncharacterized protein LOC131166681 [Malania oleifera]